MRVHCVGEVCALPATAFCGYDGSAGGPDRSSGAVAAVEHPRNLAATTRYPFQTGSSIVRRTPPLGADYIIVTVLQ